MFFSHRQDGVWSRWRSFVSCSKWMFLSLRVRFLTVLPRDLYLDRYLGFPDLFAMHAIGSSLLLNQGERFIGEPAFRFFFCLSLDFGTHWSAAAKRRSVKFVQARSYPKGSNSQKGLESHGIGWSLLSSSIRDILVRQLLFKASGSVQQKIID